TRFEERMAGMAPEVLNELRRAEAFVNAALPDAGPLNVLAAEAAYQFAMRQPARIVRCDVIQAEPGVRRDVAERRTVDLEQLELESGAYDVVLFVNVLEHVRDPLSSFPVVSRALKEKGLFVVVVPNTASVKGVMARLAPSRLRRMYYRRLSMSQSTCLPVQNVHSWRLRPYALLRAAQKNGLSVAYFRLYEGPTQKSLRGRIGLVGRRWAITVALTKILTLGLLSADETGIIAVLAKNGVSGL